MNAPDLVQGVRPVQVGDFFRCSWGYDQTNTDFYEVLSVTSSGKSVKVRQVQTAIVSHDGKSSTKVAPVPGTVHAWKGEVQTKRLRSYTDNRWEDGRTVTWPSWSFKVASYANAYLWDCRPAYETASGWGH